MWVKLVEKNMHVTRVANIIEFYPTYWFAEYLLKENGKDLQFNVRLRLADWEIAYELDQIEIEGIKAIISNVWRLTI